MNRIKLPTLLAITENPSVRYWIKKHLEEEFFIIDASKRSSALVAAQTSALDFIILDSELEECDPLELCSELKQILRTLTPILFITGRLKKSFLESATQAGVTGFLNNQLNPEELQMRIKDIQKGQSLREKTQGISGALAQKREDFSTDHLKNRVRHHTQVLKLLEEAKKENYPVSALILRVDHFNELQTSVGSSFHEKILAPFSQLIERMISKNDLFIPSNEGRFIVLLRNVPPEEGRTFAEQLRTEILKTPFSTEKGTIQVTVSIVVSSLEGGESDYNRMIDSSFKSLKKAQDLIISIEPETP